MSRPIGIHLSYWQTDWSDDVLPFIRLAKQAGFDGAEFPLLDPANMDFAAIKVELDAQGMKATCGTGLNPSIDITSPDTAIREAGMNHLRLCLEGAAALGSPVLCGVTYVPWGYFPDGDLSAYRQRCIESLREVGNIAGDLDITLSLEVLNRFEGYIINSVSQGLELLAEVGSPHVKLHLDTFHQNVEEDNIGAAIRAAGDQIGHFHCSENNRKRPGAGHIPWGEVRQALDAVNYTGWLVMESFVSSAGEVGRDLLIWHTLSDDRDADAQAGAEFMRREVAG